MATAAHLKKKKKNFIGATYTTFKHAQQMAHGSFISGLCCILKIDILKKCTIKKRIVYYNILSFVRKNFEFDYFLKFDF